MTIGLPPLPENAADYLGVGAQLARVDSFEFTDGPERGSRCLRMVNGGGLEAELHPDRALDIGRVTVNGVPIAWMSPTGMAAPALAEHTGNSWLRSFGGGLLATGGLDSVGDPGVAAGGSSYGLHGRIGSLPARVVRAEVTRSEAVVEAEIRQAAVHGEDLLLRRTISSPLGSATIAVSDTVTNQGGRPERVALLYHLNLGWPVLSEDAELRIPAADTTVADPTVSGADDPWQRMGPPEAGASSLVYHHALRERGRVVAEVLNPTSNLWLRVAFDASELPYLHEWKMLGKHQYVLGVEPSNTPALSGRARLGDAALQVLAPGESAHFGVEISVGRLS